MRILLRTSTQCHGLSPFTEPAIGGLGWMSLAPGNIAGMKYGLDISPVGDWGRPDLIAELAKVAEDHGWDGVFCEDYLAFPGGLRTYDVWVTLGLVAQATTRVTMGTMVTPLPARHAPTVTLAARSVQAVSDGRFVLGVGSGDPNGDPSSATRAHPEPTSWRRRWPRSGGRPLKCRCGSAVRSPSRGPGRGRCGGTARAYIEYHLRSGRTSPPTTWLRCEPMPGGHRSSSRSAAAIALMTWRQSVVASRHWPRLARTGGMSTCRHGSR